MTAADRVLQRLLLVLPIAQNEDGAPVAELAEELGVESRRLLKDFEELASRNDYLPAGLGDQIQFLEITRERVKLWTTGEFQRPVRLTPKEAMALELGLRIVSRPEGRVQLDDLRERLLAPLRTASTLPNDEGNGAPGATRVSGDPTVEMGDLESHADPVTSEVQAAVEARRELTIEYRALGRDPGARRIAPLILAHAEGRWYLLARDLSDQGVRAFRVDRILSAQRTDREFEPMEGDEEAVERFLGDGRVHDGGRDPIGEEAVVEYSPAIARWIREQERGELEEGPGGAVRVRLTISDPEWVVRHVLGYGAEARVLEPDWLRERVVEAVARMI